ncbi:hypothetical protein OAB59_02970 [Pelagibacteraceae bacterium]|nr:hypothetical protein [Pelagibacteraceae bacterium]
MFTSYNLNSILDAIEDINVKTKKKSKPSELISIETEKKSITGKEDILPITEKLILEAEEYSNKIKIKSLIKPILTENVLILEDEYKEQDIKILNLEQIKLNIIDDLYSSLSKKVKKNTLKVIFDLRQQISDLEEEIENINLNKKGKINGKDNSNLKINEEHLINEDNTEGEEHLINENKIEDEEYLIDEDNDSLPDYIVKTLKLQNSLIKKHERNEEKLHLKIVDLEQDLSLLGNKKTNINKNISSDSIRESKDNFADQIEVSEQQNSKTERELIFFKENYERMIVEKNEVNIKLANSKERIIMFEKNIRELEEGFENLSSILSKNSIIKLNDPLLKIHTNVNHTKKDKLK